jgi:hypothetical protein
MSKVKEEIITDNIRYFVRVLKSIAAITPGSQPQRVSTNTSNMAPQPRSITARGGKMIQSIALKRPMSLCLKTYHIK